MGTMLVSIKEELSELLLEMQQEKSERAPDPTSEKNRALALAITKVEEAQLWMTRA